MMRSEHHIGMHSFHNILISKSALVFLEQLIARKNSHFFQSRTNPNSKKNAFCYTFNVVTIISTKIMKEHTERTVRRGNVDAPHFYSHVPTFLTNAPTHPFQSPFFFLFPPTI